MTEKSGDKCAEVSTIYFFVFQDCCELDSLCKELLQNFSLLAETGYAEGVMCHTLVKVFKFTKCLLQITEECSNLKIFAIFRMKKYLL